MLSDRRQRVLAALIEEYVARAIPVGSRTLTERYELGVSPATIRNELSVLEDEGVVDFAPHILGIFFHPKHLRTLHSLAESAFT